MYEVGVVAQFEAAHRLRGDFGPATRVHGHTYKVEVVLRGRTVNDEGVLFDVGALQRVVSAEVDRLNYQNLDELAQFEGRNTTAEVVAKVLHDRLGSALPIATQLTLTVRIWESPSVFASYEATLDPPHEP